jgi:hypothetical protein
MRLASEPTARMPPVLLLIATTEGSFRTIPRPRTYTRVLAVPRSTAMSRPTNDDVPKLDEAAMGNWPSGSSGRPSLEPR